MDNFWFGLLSISIIRSKCSKCKLSIASRSVQIPRALNWKFSIKVLGMDTIYIYLFKLIYVRNLHEIFVIYFALQKQKYFNFAMSFFLYKKKRINHRICVYVYLRREIDYNHCNSFFFLFSFIIRLDIMMLWFSFLQPHIWHNRQLKSIIKLNSNHLQSN